MTNYQYYRLIMQTESLNADMLRLGQAWKRLKKALNKHPLILWLKQRW
jgi:hypothetical protein